MHTISLPSKYATLQPAAPQFFLVVLWNRATGMFEYPVEDWRSVCQSLKLSNAVHFSLDRTLIATPPPHL